MPADGKAPQAATAPADGKSATKPTKASAQPAPATKAAPAAKTAAKANHASKAAPSSRSGSGPGRLSSRPSDTATAPAETYAGDTEFLEQQRRALLEERATYGEQARLLRAEAESLVEEMEPGDVQFDEESGEGGTTTVDRERDLALSAQALAAVEEIDAALEKIDNGRYGICEGCGQLILKARLEALPFARLCIACKSGGLSRR
jgi:DnaK suppressor protein